MLLLRCFRGGLLLFVCLGLSSCCFLLLLSQKVLRADGVTLEYEYARGTLRHAFDAPWESAGFELDRYKPRAGRSKDRRDNLYVLDDDDVANYQARKLLMLPAKYGRTSVWG